ncbi:MAG: hypothetical protein JF595_16880 [Sphingomonadales bacterium]|nr:hypothetical protein [Sphingomonadales bacterium]
MEGILRQCEGQSAASETEPLNAEIQELLHTMALMLACAHGARDEPSPGEGADPSISSGVLLANGAIALGRQANSLMAQCRPPHSQHPTLVVLMGCAQALKVELLAPSAP